jgi:hypothetical protein
MKELRLTYLATFFILALFLSTLSSGLRQNVLASKNVAEGEWNKNSLQYLNQIQKNKLWTEVTINHKYNKRIAFVEPTFTYAAYKNGSFYNFYKKYTLTGLSAAKKNLQVGQTVTTDLNLLKNRPIPHGPFRYYATPTAPPYIPYKAYFKLVLQHVKKYNPYVTNITDVDVHQGKIFQTDGRNAYDVLFLFHDEYATQPEYNNLRQFVSNGGTIVFAFSNTLTTEVSYNSANDSITFVNGHHWKFDGRSAKNKCCREVVRRK